MRAEENQKLCQREQQVHNSTWERGRERAAGKRKEKKEVGKKDYLDQDTNYTVS